MRIKRAYGGLCLLFFVSLLLQPGAVFARVSNDPEGSQWAYDLLKVGEVWDVTQGSDNVIVAVIDNGIDIDHPDLRDNIWRNLREIPNNGKDDDANGYVDDIYGWNFVPDDLNGDKEIGPDENKGNPNVRPRVRTGLSESDRENISHATIVAGIIGARGDNAFDGAGLNWRVKLMSVRVVDETGISHAFVLGKAIRYAVDNGAHIINISLVGNAYDPELKSAIHYAAERGVAIVAAAGNTLTDLNIEPEYPICADATTTMPLVVGVSAIQEGRQFASFSNSGSTCIDVTAPGVGIASTVIYRPDLGFTSSYAGGKRGTSYAAPFVSGILALIKSVQPDWRAPELYDALFTSVSKTTPTNEEQYRTLFGRGLVQARAAVDLAMSKRSTQTPTGVALIVQGADEVAYMNKGEILPQVKENVIFENALSAISVRTKNTLYYILTRKDGNRTLFRVFGADGSLREERRLDIPTDSRLVAGFLTSANTPDIFVWKKGKTPSLFDVYSLSGMKKNSIKNSEGYTVKSVTTALNATTGLSHVYVLVEKNGENRVLTVDASGAVVSSVVLPKDVRVGSIVVGNIENDNGLEMVGISGPNEPMKLTYFTSAGAVIRSTIIDQPLSPYEPALRLIDLAGDSYPEIIVMTGGPNPVLRAFNAKGRLEESWRDILPEFKTRGLQLLPLFEAPKF